jgi:hypothetical protein
MVTIKQGKVQTTFLVEPEQLQRVVDTKWARQMSASEVLREAIEFFFKELNQRNPRHPFLQANQPKHRRPPIRRQRAARLEHTAWEDA